MMITKSEQFNESYNELFGAPNFEFNCENISKIMRMVGWKWADAKHLYPTSSEVAAAIYRLYHQLMDDFSASTALYSTANSVDNNGGSFEIATGGFVMTVGYTPFNGGRQLNWIELKFDVWGFELN